MDLVKLYLQIKETCAAIDKKMDLLRDDIRNIAESAQSPSAQLENSVLDYLDVAQVLHISVRQLRRLHIRGNSKASKWDVGVIISSPRYRLTSRNFNRKTTVKFKRYG